ncbi:hypothetical protein C8F04DRAFT_1200847 [Mycena alexandri]|uniref:CxC2-like cysteine cluster KDZ transposase-associated domain-containing protein n=1 Tax=Mycena alexandri TaxID=1745969 RepID=A0AAD6WLR1_9AGAR|nr:hypothetical protein C8F04DRAFT_1200847 [Mycena alexandri]
MGKRKKRTLEDPQNKEYHSSIALDDFLAGANGAQINAEVPTVIQHTSADNQRVYTEILPVAPPSPVKRAREEAARKPMMDLDDDPPLPTFDFDFDLDSDRYHMDLGGIFDRPQTPVKKGNKSSKMFKPADKSLYEWCDLRDEYLRTMLRLEGCGDADEELCPSCHQAAPTIRCRECFRGELYCAECCVKMHASNPLHIIDVWNGRWFSRTSLRDIGLRIRVHHKGCAAPVAVENFVILDVDSIHLLCHRFFPATHQAPHSAATFRCLEFFAILTHQAKTTMYDFYTTLEHATCGSGVKLLNRYPELLRMVREWRHLEMLMRAGRGHDPSGVVGTAPGALVVQCPACPRPGVNLPEDWGNAPPQDRFLYCLFLALDACFRLKRRMVSSELRDPGLGTGWGYFVEQEPYHAYLLTRTNEQEMSTCSGLAALDYANTKFSCGYSTTGVGMGVCARHEFVQPTGVGDLKKGERYSNMDYIYSAIMRWKDPRQPKKLFERLMTMPLTLRFVVVAAVMRFVIPKMHIHSHTLASQVLFSLNFLLGAGQTDGEDIERPWANLGGVATSTREMGPGARRDTLDSHLSYWNWSKLIGIAELLCTRLDKLRIEEREQTEAFEAFTQEQGERVEGWRAMVHAFEADPKKPNPYAMKVTRMTEADVRLRLSEDEQEKGELSLHDVSPSGFIYAGLDLEEQQRRVHVNIELKKAQTTTQKIDTIAMRRKLGREETPEKTPLMLPSTLEAVEREAGCVGMVATYKVIARDAQCDAALLRLRHQLHIKSRFMTYKHNNARHQGANTRSRTLVARNKSKIRLHSGKYQAAWNAIRRLQGGDTSKVGWRRLRQSDIRLMEDTEDLKKREERRKAEEARRRARTRRLRAEGETVEEDDGDGAWVDDDADEATATESRRMVSWIWTVAGTTGSDTELEEALRIEWAKAYARCRRWKEEEHRRVLESFRYEAEKWEARAGRDVIKVGEVEEGYAQGAITYALRQAVMYRDIAARAVVTATEVRLGRGKKRRRAVVVPEEEAGAPNNPT